MSEPRPVIHSLGDAALTLSLGTTISPETEARVLAVMEAVRDARVAGVIELVPAYTSLTVHYDPFETDFVTLRDQIARVATPDGAVRPAPVRRLIEIPTRYDGPDLAEVAAATGLSVEEVVARHAGAEYRVVLLGFAPGFAYLGGLDSRLALPRRASPRPRVPPRSVAIAGGQTGIYPAATPGGWLLIGTALVEVFDPARSPPNLLQVGDRVRFMRTL